MKQGWEIKKLGEVCEVLNGYAFKSELYTNEGVRVMRITNVQKGYIVDNDPKFYSEQDMAPIQQYLLRENDLLMSLTGNVGRVGILQKDMLPAALNQRVACLRIKDSSLFNNYLFHLLNSNRFESDAIFSATGIAQKNMSTEWLKKYHIPIPPVPEQEKIVAELDCLSGVIEKKKQQLKELDALSESIFYSMFGDPITNEKGWKVDRLGNLCEISSSKRIYAHEYCENGVPFYRGKEISEKSKGNDISVELYISEERYSELKNKFGVPQIGDILLTAVGTIGNIWVVDSNTPFYFKDGNVLWLQAKENINPIYFKALLYNLIDKYKESMANGCAYNALTIVNLKEMKTNKIPYKLQQEFADKIALIEKQKELIKQSIAQTEELFNERMNYYFN